MRTYSELVTLQTFDERYAYLALRGTVANPTFGSDRWLNQRFYGSREWRHLRNEIIARDLGCDLGIQGYGIGWRPTIHHMNPVTERDIIAHDEDILDPEFLICVSPMTHNAIHYGDVRQLPRSPTVRGPGDTKLW